VQDCDGVWGGSAVLDVCGDCDGDVVNIGECTGYGCTDETACNYNALATINCDDCCIHVLDCADECGGTAQLDDCGVCSGGNSGHVANADQDCMGVCDGTTQIDQCGVCNGDNLNRDCNGVCFGSAQIDNCGICGGTNDCNGCNLWYMDDFICEDPDAAGKCCEDDHN
jgi:hypothetical protein